MFSLDRKLQEFDGIGQGTLTADVNTATDHDHATASFASHSMASHSTMSTSSMPMTMTMSMSMTFTSMWEYKIPGGFLFSWWTVNTRYEFFLVAVAVFGLAVAHHALKYNLGYVESVMISKGRIESTPDLYSTSSSTATTDVLTYPRLRIIHSAVTALNYLVSEALND